MLKDPSTIWEGPFPYDALVGVGITPESTMPEILDASFDLMANGQMTPEVRLVWDDLRIADRRMIVDFFLYQIDLGQELSRTREALRIALNEWHEPIDPDSLMAPEPGELEAIAQDVRPISIEPPDLEPLPEFDAIPEPPIEDGVAFDR